MDVRRTEKGKGSLIFNKAPSVSSVKYAQDCRECNDSSPRTDHMPV